MKIAVFGWYGHDNAGDERIKSSLNNFLMGVGGIQSVHFYDLHENAIKGKTAVFNDYDLVIIGGGGLILSNHNYHDFIYGIHTKIITAGVSVETDLIGNAGKFAKALLEKSSVFLVRDRGSYEKLQSLDREGKVKISSDLTFLEPYEVVHNQDENLIGINLLSKTDYSPLILKMLVFLSRFNPVFFPKTMDFSTMLKDLSGSYPLLPIPLYCVKQALDIPEYLMNDVNYLKKYFESTPALFRHEDIDKCRAFLSMRLHGLIFAVQKCIPILTFSIYPKQINFMKELNLENYLININELERTKEKIEGVLKNEISIKEKIMNYRVKAIQCIRTDFIDVLNKVLSK